MSDLIEREALEQFAMSCVGGKVSIQQIHEFPAVEPRRGKWVKVEDPDPLLDGYLWQCSKCGTTTNATRNSVPWANYCPNCGADMRGDTDEIV